MKIRRVWIIIGVVALLLIGGLLWWKSQADAKKNEKVFEQPQTRTLEQYLEVSGEVDAKEKASLAFLAGGKITYVGAKVGDRVKKWQTLASIDLRDLQKTLQKNLNNYMIERLTFDQNREDRRDIQGDSTINTENAQDQFTLNNTVLDVEVRDIALRNGSIYSPINGILVASPTEVPGTMVLGTDDFVVVNPETMIFSADVDEADISKITEGMSGTVKLDAYSSIEIPVTVRRIAFESSESSTGTVFAVEFDLPKDHQNIEYRLGMNGSVKILIRRQDSALSIPLRSVVERDGKNYVDVQVGEGKTEQKEITLGLETDDYVEVTSGLSESDKVLVR